MNIKIFLAAAASSMPPAFAAPEKSLRGPDPARDGEAGALQAAQAGDDAPRARRLQDRDCGDIRGSLGDGEFCGFCLDGNGKMYDTISFEPVSNSDECLARCPSSHALVGSDKFVGYEYAPEYWWLTNVCNCLYEGGFLDNVHFDCPSGAFCRQGSGEGQVASGSRAHDNVACRTRYADDTALRWAEETTRSVSDEDFAFFVASVVRQAVDVNGMIVANVQKLIDYADQRRCEHQSDHGECNLGSYQSILCDQGSIVGC